MRTADLKSYRINEKKFYAWFRDNLNLHVNKIHIQRVENTVSPGLPDLNICSPDLAELWIELKITLPDGVILRKEQYAWGIKRAMCGGDVYILSLNRDDSINIYRFPAINVEPRGNQGRYVRIVSEPHKITTKSGGILSIYKYFLDPTG